MGAPNRGGRGGGRTSAGRGGRGGRGGASGGPRDPPQRDVYVPKHLDEDVDDDLAFDSEDEKKYGAYFKKNAAAAGSKKRQGGDGDSGSESFGEAYDSDGGFDSDDSREEIDISELLDSKEDRKKAAEARRQARAEAASGAAATTAKGKAAKSKKGERALQPESLLDVSTASSAVKAPGQRVANLAVLTQALSKSNSNDKQLQARLQNIQSTQGLIGTELDQEDREKMDREEVRDATKADMKKWRSFIKEQVNSRTLNFPLNAPDANPVPTTISGIAHIHQDQQQRKVKQAAEAAESGAAAPIATKVGGGTALALTMNELLGKSGLGTTKQHKEVFQAHVKSTTGADAPEEGFVPLDGEGASAMPSAPDMNYIAKLKALVGYDIAKRKRFNKIKSKTYRRILRKEKEREQEMKQRALELLDPEAARKRTQRKLEKLRAEERVTQKHKNTSKWVKHVKHMANFDEGTKEALQEQDVLRRRLMAKADESADDELEAAAELEYSSEEEERRVDELLKGAGANATSALWSTKGTGAGKKRGSKFDTAEASNREGLDDATGDERADRLAKSRKQLEGMGFMQKARARHEEQFKAEAALLLEDVERHRKGLAPLHVEEALAGLGSSDDDEDRAELRKLIAAEEGAVNVSEGGIACALKAQVANARAAAAKEKAAQRKADQERLAQMKTTEAGSGRKAFAGGAQGGNAKSSANLVQLPATSGIVAGEGIAVSKTERAKLALEKQLNDALNAKNEKKKAGKRSLSAAEDALVDEGAADEDDVAVGLEDSSAAAAPGAGGADAAASQEKPTKRNRAEGAASQRTKSAVVTAAATASADAAPRGEKESHDYLIARAFARDDIDEDFAAAKAAQVEAAMKPEDPNASLPGWGEWGGASEHLNQKHKSRVEENTLKRNIERTALASARADAKLDHAIINHEVGMVVDKHTLHMVPRPFDSAVQYQRATRQPLGPEFNSVKTFQDGVAPRVVTKRGVAIDPVDEGKTKKAKTTRRKVQTVVDIGSAAGKKVQQQKRRTNSRN